MPRNPDRTRQEWIEDEKRTAVENDPVPRDRDEYVKFSTLGEIAEVLGRDEKTIKRRLKRGAMPEPDVHTKHGWRLWSPGVVRQMIRDEGATVSPRGSKR